MQLFLVIIHAAKIKSLPHLEGFYKSITVLLFDGLKAKRLDIIFTCDRLHKNSRAVISGFCLKSAHTKLTTILITFMFYVKRFDNIIVKKILKNKNRLCL